MKYRAFNSENRGQYPGALHMHKKDLGSLGEALVAAQCLQHGCSVFTEFGDNSKIDIIVQGHDYKLHRVQVKYVSREEKQPGVTKLYLYKSGPNKYYEKYTPEQIDWFAVVDDQTKQVAWVSVEEALQLDTWFMLRHEPPANGQKKGIRMFSDYVQFPFK